MTEDQTHDPPNRRQRLRPFSHSDLHQEKKLKLKKKIHQQNRENKVGCVGKKNKNKKIVIDGGECYNEKCGPIVPLPEEKKRKKFIIKINSLENKKKKKKIKLAVMARKTKAK